MVARNWGMKGCYIVRWYSTLGECATAIIYYTDTEWCTLPCHSHSTCLKQTVQLCVKLLSLWYMYLYMYGTSVTPYVPI